jgi:hypothetical protein
MSIKIIKAKISTYSETKQELEHRRRSPYKEPILAKKITLKVLSSICHKENYHF